MVMFKWHTADGDACFNCSRWNGRVFPDLNEVPELPVHPNCQCLIQSMIDPRVQADLERLGSDLDRVRRAAAEAFAAISLYNLSPWLSSHILSAIKGLVIEIQKFIEACEIFKRNRDDMIKAATKDADKYFHSKANAEAARLGPTGEAAAALLSEVREHINFWQYLYEGKMRLDEIIRDWNNDDRANRYGRQVGSAGNPDKPIQDYIDIFRPNGLDEKY